MFRLLFLMVIIFATFNMIKSTEINRIAGQPTVHCKQDTISINFQTMKPFHGRIYARGLSGDYRCSRNFQNNENSTDFYMVVIRGDCNMNSNRDKVRNTDASTYMLSLVVVVSFHGTFVTKSDRAYRLMCAFDQQRLVSNQIAFNGISPTELRNTMDSPSCVYELRAGTVDGPSVAYARVGDPIVHVWTCHTDTHRMWIHSCEATDVKGNVFYLFDSTGCAIDPVIMPGISYDGYGARAHVVTHGFKFSDDNSIAFACEVELCNRFAQECADMNIPPKCGLGRKKRNNANGRQVVAEMDVLDRFHIDQLPRTLEPTSDQFDVGTYSLESTCLPRWLHVLLMSSTVVLFALSLFLITYICNRTKS